MHAPCFVLFSIALSACHPGFMSVVVENPEDTSATDSGEPDDNDAPDDDPAWLGTGADGDLELHESTQLDVEVQDGREHPDAVRYAVATIDGATVTLDEAGLGLAEGDEALLINMRGTAEANAAVGNYAFVRIEAVSSAELTLTDPVEVVLGEESNEDLSGQVVVLQRVPNYSWLIVSEGVVLSASDWDRLGGGVLALRASEGIHVRDTAAIDLSGLGYEGGDTGSAGCDGYQGESITGWGQGGTCGSGYNETPGYYEANAGGGGCNITGGGGGYGAFGMPGDAWNSGYTAPSGGDTYGDETLSQLFMGSGGGGIWNGSGSSEGPGGDGGGIAFIATKILTVDEGGFIRATGDDTEAWSQGSYSYGAGGGAGGSLWIVAEDLQLAADSVLATGGAGEDSHQRAGGDGGAGRIRVDCRSCNDAEHGSASATAALVAACEPDPGWSEAPED